MQSHAEHRYQTRLYYGRPVGRGGTGAAPMEFTDAVGMPLRNGLAFVVDALNGFDLKKDIKVIASGKIVFGFHIFRALALGADACNGARAMMMALGCNTSPGMQ